MCNLSDGVEARGIVQGMAQSILNAMTGFNVTLEQAMTGLGIPQEEFEKYEKLVKK